MAKPITVSDHEPVEEWLNKLARDAPEEWLFPSEYEAEEVEQLVTQVREKTDERKRALETDTMLSEREAEVVALKEAGLTHNAIALVLTLPNLMGLVSLEDHFSPNTVDEYARRAREKYHKARRTAEELDALFSG